MTNIHLKCSSIQEHTTPIADVKSWVTSHTSNRSRVFQMVAHGNKERPCMTTSADPRPGKPCLFPFIFPDCNAVPFTGLCTNKENSVPVTHTECTMIDGSFPWCSTKTRANSSHILGEFGTCSPQCLNKSAIVESLADDKFNLLWEENIFRLFKDDIGHCHTYNPEHQSASRHEDKFVAFLGKLSSKIQGVLSDFVFYFKGHHEDGAINFYYTG